MAAASGGWTLPTGKRWTEKPGLAWRALTEGMDGGAQAVIVLLCSERLFQPVGDRITVDHSDGTPFDDGSPYASGGAEYEAAASAALRATSMPIMGGAEKPVIGGELFSIEHPNWGWRAYRVIMIDGSTITFRPPLREAVTPGTPLEFDTPRCKMRIPPGAAPSNATNIGKYTACSIVLVEDMRKPA
jgi:hypothetical protein